MNKFNTYSKQSCNKAELGSRMGVGVMLRIPLLCHYASIVKRLRRRSAKPLSPVQIRVDAPYLFLRGKKMKIIKQVRDEYQSYIHQTNIYRDQMHCSECGSFLARTSSSIDILPEYKYCPYCGEKL